MNKTRDKQLKKLEMTEVMSRRRLDQALNMKQFALSAGISYSAAREWCHQPGFPVIRGYVFWSDFVEWRRARMNLHTAAPPQPAPQHHPHHDRTKFSPRAQQILASAR